MPWPCAASTCSGGACTGFTVTATSCQGSGGSGLTDCGESSESCCTSLEVTGGTYFRTYDLDLANVLILSADGGPTDLADPATVSGFRLDKYLVTVGRFRQFVNAFFPPDGGSGWLPAPGSGKHLHLNGGDGLNVTAGGYEPGWLTTDNGNIAPTDTNLACDPTWATWTSAASTKETLPINCVNWYVAYTFCIWDGGFLPSEAEWEYAAAGGNGQREYPWGSTDPGTSNQYAIYGGFSAGIAPVGTATLGAGLWGQLDLAGEVWEWNLDYYGDYADPCTDCTDTTEVYDRVLRGMDSNIHGALWPPLRNSGPPSFRFSEAGFRCARTP
jgi:formylglycine-generating enzyme required for sulfatase activity